MTKTAVLVMAGALAAGCADNPGSPTAPMSVPVFDAGNVSGHSNVSANSNGGNFGTPLSADEEVLPPTVTVPNDSKGRGSAIFHLSADGTALEYKLIVANIENVIMAHIHQAPVGVNGPIVVWLFPSTAIGPPGQAGLGRFQGPIAEGVISEANLTGPLADGDLSDLIDLITSGNAYVNVHTDDGVPPQNTGAGDFFPGEIRGQVEHRGH